MLKLSDKSPFAEGTKRACYVHPEDPNYCIKVLRQDAQPAELRSMAPWYKRLQPLSKFDSNHQELEHLTQIHQRTFGTNDRIVPATKGFIETDLGSGLVVELFRNPNGQICETLQAFVREHGFTDQASDALDRLTDKMLKYGIQLKDPGTTNIICQIQENGSLACILVDGFKTASFPYIAGKIPPITNFRIQRKINKVRKRLGGKNR